ncbi:hypothetical protein lerEdw1_005520 [Lerista edwardsae]|nr:hypothetical protein lerEdw1_005520 [Lerista edwardsae]
MKVILLLAFLCLASEAFVVRRYMEKCEFLRTMKQYGMDGYHGFHLGMWGCLARYATRMDTRFHVVEGGIPYYGLFRINAQHWCDNGVYPSENRCGISCSKFLDYDLRDDIACVRKIVVSSPAYWSAYHSFCRREVIHRYAQGCSLALV